MRRSQVNQEPQSYPSGSRNQVHKSHACMLPIPYNEEHKTPEVPRSENKAPKAQIKRLECEKILHPPRSGPEQRKDVEGQNAKIPGREFATEAKSLIQRRDAKKSHHSKSATQWQRDNNAHAWIIQESESHLPKRISPGRK